MFVAIGPFCWGRDEQFDKAVANCRKEYPRKGSPYHQGPFRCVVFEVDDPNVRVDGMGGIVHAGDKTLREVSRIGKWPKEKKSA